MDKEDAVCVYTMEYYSAIRKDEYPPFTLTWLELEGIMLSETSQSEKDNYHMVSLMWNIRNSERDHKGRRGTEWEKLERETNHERLLSLRNKGLWKWGKDGVMLYYLSLIHI